MFKFIDGSSKPAVQVIVLVAFICTVYLAGASSHPEAEVSIDFGGQVRVFRGEVNAGMTVLDALSAAVTAGSVPLRLTIDSARDLTQVMSTQASTDLIESKKIQFYVNDNLINGAKIHQTPIRPQDKVTVKLL